MRVETAMQLALGGRAETPGGAEKYGESWEAWIEGDRRDLVRAGAVDKRLYLCSRHRRFHVRSSFNM